MGDEWGVEVRDGWGGEVGQRLGWRGGGWVCNIPGVFEIYASHLLSKNRLNLSMRQLDFIFFKKKAPILFGANNINFKLITTSCPSLCV